MAHRGAVPAQRVPPPRRRGLGLRDGRPAQGARDRRRARQRQRAARAPGARARARRRARRRPSTRSRSPSTSSAPDTHARPSPSWLGARRKWAIARSSRMSTTGASGSSRETTALPSQKRTVTGNWPSAPASVFMPSTLDATVRRPSGKSVAAPLAAPDRSLCILQPHYRCPYGGWARAPATAR